MNRFIPIVSIIILFFLLCPYKGIPQQTLLLDEVVDNEPDMGSWGQNKPNYLELRILYGFLNKWEEYSYPVKFFGSGEFETIVKYKLKLNPIFSAGFSTAYLNQHYRVDIDPGRSEEIPDRESFRINSIKPAIFFRINIDPKRGNYSGKYIESGLYGTWSFSSKKVTVFTYEGGEEAGFRRSREVQAGLSYLNRINYGTYLSIGFGNYELSYRHRMSRIIDDQIFPIDPRIDYIVSDFPRNTLAISVRISL